MTPSQKKRLKSLIAKHVDAQVELSWLGLTEDVQIKEERKTQAKVAKANLMKYINDLQSVWPASTGYPKGV